MARAFEVDGYEPFQGAHKRPDSPVNEAHLHLRDAAEVYGQLYDRDVDTAFTADLRNGTLRIKRTDIDAGPLQGSVETRNSRATMLDYQFSFTPPEDNPNAYRDEYTAARTLLEPGERNSYPKHLVADAGIVLEPADIGAMLDDGTITTTETYTRENGPLPCGDMDLDDLTGVDLDDTDPWFAPTITPEDTSEWTFRIRLHDRSREEDTVTYTVDIQADRTTPETDPFSDHAEDVGRITFTTPLSSETLEQTAETYPALDD